MSSIANFWMVLLTVTLFASSSVFSQTSTEISEELLRMKELDQQGRLEIREIEKQHGYDSPQWQAAWDTQNAVDAANMQRLEEIIAEKGWPKSSEVGEDVAETAFFILQHAGLDMQRKYLQTFKDAVVAREAEADQYALLYDRVLMREGKKQLYGTQLRRNEQTGGWYLWPIEDEARVDARRSRLGMRTLEEELASYPFEIGSVPQDVADGFLPVPQ